MEGYQEPNVILSDVVPPQTDPDVSSVELVSADPCAIPVADYPDYPPAPLWDTADCSPADVAPVTCPDPANRSPAIHGGI